MDGAAIPGKTDVSTDATPQANADSTTQDATRTDASLDRGQGGTTQGGTDAGLGGSVDVESPEDAAVDTGAEPDAHTDSLDETDATSATFLEIWKAHQAELLSEENAPSPGQEAPCSQCLENLRVDSLDCGPPYGDCYVGTACITRHCLCTPETYFRCTEESYPSNLRDCVESCLPIGQSTCKAAWFGYMSCVVRGCTEACLA